MSDALQTAPPTDCSSAHRLGQGAHHTTSQGKPPTVDPPQTAAATTAANALLHLPAQEQLHTDELNAYYYTANSSPCHTSDNASVLSSAPIGRASSVLNTVYFTARTSVPSRASTRSNRLNNGTPDHQSATVSSNLAYGDVTTATQEGGAFHTEFVDLGFLDEIDNQIAAQEEEEEVGEEAGNDDAENDGDTLTEYELTHLPPFLPDVKPYFGFGRSLRESVLYRQNTRMFPPEDRHQERMEDQLVRWGAPQSLFHVDEILNGKHAFQKDDMPVLEVVPRDLRQGNSSTSEEAESSSMGSGTVLTSSTQNSIAKSPFLTESPNRAHARYTSTPKSIFVEDNSGVSPLTADNNGIPLGVIYEQDQDQDQDSIQESPAYMYEPHSASITNSMRLQLNRSDSHLNTPTDTNEPPTATALPVSLPGELIVDPPTAEAMPVSMEEVRNMVKNPPPMQTSLRAQEQLLRAHGASVFDETGLRLGQELTFWQALCEIWSLCCDDMSACLSCEWCCEQEEPEPVYHYRVEREITNGVSDTGNHIANSMESRLPPRRGHTL